jgi:hypothetical protein
MVERLRPRRRGIGQAEHAQAKWVRELYGYSQAPATDSFEVWRATGGEALLIELASDPHSILDELALLLEHLRARQAADH